jgi:UDP-N-acetylmuramoyl-tripeptide--D-alanyl-D-alanine ligase
VQLRLREIRDTLELAEPADLDSAVVSGWSIDTRTLCPGDLFFAIKGETQDGHAYVNAAFEKGAVAAVVSEAVEEIGITFRVADTLGALQKLAVYARRRWAKPIVAVTGSAGKTTTKDVIAELLSVRFEVGKTAGNLNNHIGLPLSLLRLPDSAGAGVIELGMNHAGEIRFLASLAQPQIGVVTNVGYAHIESFNGIDGIALAKRELIEELGPDGTAVLNADDPRVLAFMEVHKGRVVTYGFSAGADVRGERLELSANGVKFRAAGVEFRSGLIGRHGASNLLAGIAVAEVFGIQAGELVDAVARVRPGKMRGERENWKGITILNDCYNSNPDAARLMIDVLKEERAGRRIAVLGEMLELGQWSDWLHEQTGRYAAESNIDVVIGIHGAARRLVQGALEAGANRENAHFFDDPHEAGEFLRGFARAGDAILFKGSRGTHVERALAAMES